MSTRVLHVATRHIPGGAAANTLHFMGWQAQAGLTVELAVGRDSDLAALPPALASHVVPHLVRAVRPASDARAFAELRRLVGAGAYDLVHTHQSKAGVLGRWAARGRARTILHTVHMTSFGPGYSHPASVAFLRAERWCARFTDVLIAVGEELRERYLAAGVGSRDRFRVIRSPIELDAFGRVREASESERQAARDELDIVGVDPVVLVVAALERRKRVGLVVEALADRLRAGWTLVVAGQGPERPRLEALAGRLGVADRVRFLGHVSDVPGVMRASTLLVHAALAEGVPQVVLQALAAGLPVVATDVVGLREVPGARLSIARTDGADLRLAVEATVEAPPTAVPPASLGPWSVPSIESEIRRLHADLGVA